MPPQLVSSHLICLDELTKDANEVRRPLQLGAFQLRIKNSDYYYSATLCVIPV
jgi:hypothetical protein